MRMVPIFAHPLATLVTIQQQVQRSAYHKLSGYRANFSNKLKASEL